MCTFPAIIFPVFILMHAGNKPGSTATHGSAVFSLEIVQSEVMNPGKDLLSCVCAVAVPMRRSGLIKFHGIDIFFGGKSKDGLVPRTAEEIQHGDYANMNLLTDSSNRVTQVNMTVVRPGRTVARTIAWKSGDIKKYFSRVTVTADRVVLKSTGRYEDPLTDKERVILRWEVNIDIPIVNK